MKFSFHTRRRHQAVGWPPRHPRLRGAGRARARIFKPIDGALDGLRRPPRRRRAVQGQEGPDPVAAHARARRPAARRFSSVRGARKDFKPADLRGFAAPRRQGRRPPRRPREVAARAAVPRRWRQRRTERAAQFLAEGALLGSYKFDKYLTGDRRSPSPSRKSRSSPTPDNVDGSARSRRSSAASQRGEQVAAGVRARARPHQRARRRHDADARWPRSRRRSPSSTASRSRCSARRSARSSAWACSSPSPRAPTRSRASST